MAVSGDDGLRGFIRRRWPIEGLYPDCCRPETMAQVGAISGVAVFGMAEGDGGAGYGSGGKIECSGDEGSR